MFCYAAGMMTTSELITIRTAPASLADGILSVHDAAAAAAVLKAVADPVRLRLLAYIVDNGGADVCICDMPLAVGMSQPTVSHHMKKLTEAGLVTRQQRGRWVYFTLVPAAFAELRRFLQIG